MLVRLACTIMLAVALVPSSLICDGTVASPGVDFSLVPANRTVSVGQVFTIDIGVDASSQELDTVEVHVSFDTGYLQVVDEDDNLLTGITDGAIVPGSITTTVLTTGLLNRVDNGSGHASIAYGIPPGGDPINEVIILGTIRVKAVAETTGATLVFSTTQARKTLATRSGVNVTGDLAGSTVVITATDSPGEEDTEGPPAPDDGESSIDETDISVSITSPGDGTTSASEAGETPSSPQDKPLTWPLMGGLIGGTLVIGLVVYFLTARARF